VAKKKPSLSSSVVPFMSVERQAQIDSEESEGLSTLPLDSILPDSGQPRRLLPDDLAEAVAANTLSRIEALQAWIQRAEVDTAPPTLRYNIRELKRLADSVERHGLISPISVRKPQPDETVPSGTEYLIVTGERRYWAHLYLVNEGKQIQEGETTADPAQIKVTIAQSGITVRAHQLIENLLREDINAIERARGMWALRYELSGVNYSSPSGDDEVDEEGVNYSSPQLVPWARVEETLGISKRYRIFVTSVLKLSQEAQKIVEAHALAEMTIRPIVQKLKDKPELQVKALKQLVAWQAENEAGEGPGRSIVASVKELVDQLLAGETAKAKKITRSVSSAPVIRFHNKLRQTLDFISRLKPTDREGLTEALGRNEFVEVMIDLRHLRQQIDVILETVTEAHPADDEMPLPKP